MYIARENSDENCIKVFDFGKIIEFKQSIIDKITASLNNIKSNQKKLITEEIVEKFGLPID